MKIAQIFWTENKSFLKHCFEWISQRSSITVKPFFALLLFTCTTNLLVAQERLSSMPKERRDSTLVDIVQKLLKDKFPEWYRKDIYPIITQSDFTGSFLEWLRKESPRVSHAPDYLKPEDLRYSVTLYSEKWGEEKFESQYTARVIIIERSQEVLKIMLGSNLGYSLPTIKDLNYQESLSSMPVEKRDNILVEIAQNCLKEKYPEMYRKDISPAIEQGDFKLLNINWARDDKYISLIM